ncbi:hypothetical protein D3C81_2321340 [compost metagenome]
MALDGEEMTPSGTIPAPISHRIKKSRIGMLPYAAFRNPLTNLFIFAYDLFH